MSEGNQGAFALVPATGKMVAAAAAGIAWLLVVARIPHVQTHVVLPLWQLGHGV